MAKKIPTTKLCPVDDRAVIQRIPAEKESAGGIILPELAKKTPNIGIVLRVGAGRYVDGTQDRLPMSVRRGDKVVFGQYDGTEQEIDGMKIVILRERDILAVLDKEEDEDEDA